MLCPDTHFHLDHLDPGGAKAVLEHATEEGVSPLLTVIDAYTPASWALIEPLLNANTYPLWAAAGAHPHEASSWNPDTARHLETLLNHPRVVALGEIGLDFHYTLSPPDTQRKVFCEQVRMARGRQLPITLHTRAAEEEVLAFFEREPHPWGLVFHCYTGPAELVTRIQALGAMISLSGAVTFKKGRALQDVVEAVDPGHLLLETDSPYLSPEPFRGKTNTPANIPLILKHVASAKGMSPEALAGCIRENTQRVFSLPV